MSVAIINFVAVIVTARARVLLCSSFSSSFVLTPASRISYDVDSTHNRTVRDNMTKEKDCYRRESYTEGLPMNHLVSIKSQNAEHGRSEPTGYIGDFIL